MKKLCILLLVLSALLSMAACNTVKGVGQDIEGVGDAMKDAAN